MQLYGASLIWGTASAPTPATCILENCDYKLSSQTHHEPDGSGDHAASVLYRQKGAISFGGTITDATVDLPDLSAGALITLAHAQIVGGIVLCPSLIEEWAMDQPKKFTGSANHYPDATAGTGAAAGVLDGTFAQVAPVIRPASKLVWSTAGLTHAAGTVQRLRIEQTWNLSEPPTDPLKILSIIANGYMRKITVEILALPNASLPANDTILAVTGAPGHAGGAVISDSGFKWKRADAAMIEAEAFWHPGLAA